MKIGGIGLVEGFNRPNMMAKKTSGAESSASEFSLPLKPSATSKASQRDEQREKLAGAGGITAPTVQSNPSSPKVPENRVTENRAAESRATESRVEDRTVQKPATTSPATVRASAESKAAPEQLEGGVAATASVRSENSVQVGKPSDSMAVSDETAEAASSSVQAALTQVIQDLAADLSTVQVIEQDARNGAMNDFLVQMKSEFGIEPQQVIKAFAELSPQKLEASPEATMSDVLKSLGIQPEQMPKAERIYKEMLNTTGESVLNETLAGVGAGVTLQVLSEKEVALDKLQKSITDLNDSFAIRNQPTLQNATAVTVDNSTSSVDEPPAELKESSTRDLSVALKAALNPVSVENGVMSDLGVTQVAAAAKPSSVGQKTSESLEAILKDVSVSDQPAPGFVLPEQGKTGTLSASSGLATAAGSMMPQTEGAIKENAQEVIRNAQLLLQKGGGEMKMQLKPEGVGEVHLKVQVKDGQVAVQMLTESDSAKKLLETGLDDLKTSLAANKLHVDALKIEVGTEMAKQRFEQSQQDASREQARQLAQDFMGQFRQDREAFRQGFADGSGLRSYGAQRRPAPPEMEAVTTQSQNKSSSSRRLDLVA